MNNTHRRDHNAWLSCMHGLSQCGSGIVNALEMSREITHELTTCLTSCRRRLSSSQRSAASYLLMPPLPFASCTPPLPFASCLPAGCHVAPVVAPPPTPPRNFATTSSLPSGCRNSQCPTCRATAASRPLAASVALRAASASRRVTA